MFQVGNVYQGVNNPQYFLHIVTVDDQGMRAHVHVRDDDDMASSKLLMEDDVSVAVFGNWRLVKRG